MKHITKYILGITLVAALASCKDFDSININPSAAGDDAVRADYLLATSFQQAQQNPNDAERVFVYNWASIARVTGENSFGCAARYSDDYNSCLYNFSSNSIKAATQAINNVDYNLEKGTYNTHDKDYFNNVKQIARIWRCMVIADFVDCFGPYPLDAFQGKNPHFNSVEEVYYFIFEELADAQAALKKGVTLSDSEKKQDIAYNMDADKWQKLANSLRLRYALRLSEVAPEKAKSEFEAAAVLPLLESNADLFGFQEYGGWSDWEGVYNRSWSDHVISSSMVNILSGIGGVSTASSYSVVSGSTQDITPYIKDMEYIGIEYKNHYPEKTDNPMNGMWLDGIPKYVDPRAFVIYNLPNDPTAKTYSSPASQTVKGYLSHGMQSKEADGSTPFKWGKEDATMTFNGPLAGVRTAWIKEAKAGETPNFTLNNLLTKSWDVCSFLSGKYRDNSQKRMWFGVWETHFLLAEGAYYGWNAGVSAKSAYEAGVMASFEHHGIGQYAADYLASEEYNRVGTSAKFDHTTEPSSFTASYYDGYENEVAEDLITGRGSLKRKTYNYPDPNKALYKGHKLNDQLVKIITQKYIANTPYGAVEMWNDRRRLGLPFFEVPGAEISLSGSDIAEAGTFDPAVEDCREIGQNWGMFTQRMRYPTSLSNADPKEYQHALELLGGNNNMMVPIWWYGFEE